MPVESKQIYRISSLNLAEINLIFSRIGDRLDQIEGYRGDPVFRSTTEFKESEIKYTDSNGTIIHSVGGI